MDRLKADQPILHDHSGDEAAPTADNDALEAPPRAFLPITPFGDAKPFAGSLVDPTDPRHDEEVAERMTGTTGPDARDEAEEGHEADEADEAAEVAEEVRQDDFAARNVLMSNALPENPTPAAGVLTQRQDEEFLEPTTDEEQPAPESRPAPDR